MLSLLGSLLGFGSSFLPKIMDYFQDRQDKAHELAVLDKQLNMQLQGQEMRLAEINVEGDIREMEALQASYAKVVRKASQWCINLSASVRPVISYLFFLEFLALTAAVSLNLIDRVQYQMVWNNEMQAIFAAVISFWFGQRSFGRK